METEAFAVELAFSLYKMSVLRCPVRVKEGEVPYVDIAVFVSHPLFVLAFLSAPCSNPGAWLTRDTLALDLSSSCAVAFKD